ncbi:hypothetical protein LXA43DRAFT_1184840 [Ganoderma leucocontextum]|nr:hypothetical protein LXA43DRAFT_1184840 [Ganoderma leucocontextum]
MEYKAHVNHLLTVQILVQDCSQATELVDDRASSEDHYWAEHTDKMDHSQREIRDGAFMPSAVLDAEQGIFVLRRGDFAILQMQFRLCDGTLFRREFEAPTLMDSLFLPGPVASRIELPWAEDPSMMQYLARDINIGLGTSL